MSSSASFRRALNAWNLADFTVTRPASNGAGRATADWLRWVILIDMTHYPRPAQCNL